MCLGVPGRVIEVVREDALLMALVEFGGIRKSVCIEYVPEACPGDYVLVHVGFALARLDEAEARRVFELLEAMGELDGLKEAPR